MDTWSNAIDLEETLIYTAAVKNVSPNKKATWFLLNRAYLSCRFLLEYCEWNRETRRISQRNQTHPHVFIVSRHGLLTTCGYLWPMFNSRGILLLYILNYVSMFGTRNSSSHIAILIYGSLCVWEADEFSSPRLSSKVFGCSFLWGKRRRNL